VLEGQIVLSVVMGAQPSRRHPGFIWNAICSRYADRRIGGQDAREILHDSVTLNGETLHNPPPWKYPGLHGTYILPFLSMASDSIG
jgi:hypothetical protein